MTASEIVEQVKELPLVPETARKLVVLLNDSDSHRSDLIQTLRCDNVMTAKLLRACNTARIGLREPVSSVDQAVLLLGDNAIFKMVCAIGFGDAMGFAMPGYAIEANGLWGHSLSTGMGAEYLTEIEGLGNFKPSIAFTAGLLHDIGKLILSQILTPKTRGEIRSLISQDSLSRFQAEKIVLGADHAEVGACLLEKWLLPNVIVEAVANHHSPILRPAIRMSAVVYLANYAAHLAGPSAGCPEVFALRPDQSIAAMYGMELKKVERIVTGAHEAMRAVNQYLSVA